MNNFLSIDDINKIETIISYKFKNPKFLITSFTHSSFDQETNYEKLEFLGDSLINFYSTLHIYNKCNNKVGVLSVKRTQIINNELLSLIINHLELDKFILIGKNVNVNTKISSDVFESLSAAIFLDSNMETLFDFLEKTLLKHKNLHNKIDFKGKLVSYIQTKYNYNYKFDTKYDERKKIFKTTILLDKHTFSGFGSNKKNAEQNASKKALECIIKN